MRARVWVGWAKTAVVTLGACALISQAVSTSVLSETPAVWLIKASTVVVRQAGSIRRPGNNSGTVAPQWAFPCSTSLA